MSSFDIAVGLAAVGAMVLGFRSGLIRSVATIVAYLCAAPLAVKGTALVLRAIDKAPDPGSVQTFLIFFGILVMLGVAIAAGFNAAVDEMSGPDISLPDRFAGSILGVVRVGLIAVTAVLVFERIIPAG